MAEGPGTTKRFGWLWIAVLAALAVLALIWIFTDEDDAATDPADLAAETTPAITTAGPVDVVAVSEVAMLANIQPMIGRDVEFTDVAVNRVIGDEGFTVGEGDAETLVMFDERPTPDTPMEGHVDVNPGSRVTLSGTVRSLEGVDLPTSVRDDVEAQAPAYIVAEAVRTE